MTRRPSTTIRQRICIDSGFNEEITDAAIELACTRSDIIEMMVNRTLNDFVQSGMSLPEFLILCAGKAVEAFDSDGGAYANAVAFTKRSGHTSIFDCSRMIGRMRSFFYSAGAFNTRIRLARLGTKKG